MTQTDRYRDHDRSLAGTESARCHYNKQQNMTNYDNIRQDLTIYTNIRQYVTKFDIQRQDLTIYDHMI